MRIRRPLRWLLVLAVVLLVAIAWRATHEPTSLRELADHHTPIGKIEPSTADDEGRPAAAVAYGHEQAARKANVVALDRARRDALRERILEREQAVARIAARRSAEHEATKREEDDADADAGPGLTDRIGGRDALVNALNRDFLPLADECIEQARERKPALQGMLTISLELVADPELGAVIDSTEYPAANEVHEDELLDCIRETALATTLPPPPAGGREGFMITLKVGEDTAG